MYFLRFAAVLTLVGVSNGFLQSTPDVFKSLKHISPRATQLQMSLDTRAAYAKHKEQWKNFYTKDGKREFADEFASDGKMFMNVDQAYVLEGPAAVLNFLEDWKVAYDIENLHWSTPACSDLCYACSWTAQWKIKASGILGTTKGFILCKFNDDGKIIEYHDVMDKGEYNDWLASRSVGNY
eukprot:CAMPEP_0113934118 /NCGR_PEP_ID=MMETSP1339-20121228/1446_1 /TAXON_ID=94617 /ORGANISM="Fibrocapsa japonica" /LENGTH=180 /DNA_ID=CAMNT_0000935771 /DNA_START=83 /DNA_END=625 /DNA_ORIENTATION=+ /assembly_acc=CAM_ASM_000762